MSERDIVVDGVGVQCHCAQKVVENKRLEDILHLHLTNKGEMATIDFWKSIEMLRGGNPMILFSDALSKSLAMVHDDKGVVLPHQKTIEEIEAMMNKRGFIGFMLPSGVFFFKKKDPIFGKFCRFVGANIVT